MKRALTPPGSKLFYLTAPNGSFLNSFYARDLEQAQGLAQTILDAMGRKRGHVREVQTYQLPRGTK